MLLLEGHGYTADVMDRSFHYHDMAEDTVELMDQLGIESAVVVGYSDGGIIGLDMAVHHPERVTKLAVTGANARFDGYTTENKEWIRGFDPGTLPVSEPYAQLSPTAITGELQAMNGLADASPAAGWQVMRRASEGQAAITYTVTVQECAIDDPDSFLPN